jgi:hypothetical protein
MNVNGLARLRWTRHQSGAVAEFVPFLAAGFRGHELLMAGEERVLSSAVRKTR